MHLFHKWQHHTAAHGCVLTESKQCQVCGKIKVLSTTPYHNFTPWVNCTGTVYVLGRNLGETAMQVRQCLDCNIREAHEIEVKR